VVEGATPDAHARLPRGVRDVVTDGVRLTRDSRIDIAGGRSHVAPVRSTLDAAGEVPRAARPSTI
jgi:hypothetical protein